MLVELGKRHFFRVKRGPAVLPDYTSWTVPLQHGGGGDLTQHACPLSNSRIKGWGGMGRPKWLKIILPGNPFVMTR